MLAMFVLPLKGKKYTSGSKTTHSEHEHGGIVMFQIILPSAF